MRPERAVPRDDGADDADRLAHEQAELAAHAGLAGSSKGKRVGQAGVVLEGGRGRRRGALGDRVEHAGLAGPDLAEVRAPLLQSRRNGPQVLGPLGVGHPGPRALVEGLAAPRPTARAMSASLASATLKKTSSVAESITSISASDDGSTHSPPMKNRSACTNEAAARSPGSWFNPPLPQTGSAGW